MDKPMKKPTKANLFLINLIILQPNTIQILNKC